MSEQSIEQLQQRYEKLHTKKIQTEANLENARKQLEQLKREALEKYGTDDLEELRVKLEAMTTENEKKRRDYQVQLDGIEKDLANVERNFHGPGALSDEES